MPKNRYDPLLFLPYSLSVACQGKTTPEPSGTRLSFETHRTGEFRNVPGASKQDIQHMVKAQRILLKKGRKKAPNFSHQEFRRVEKSRVQRLETAQSHSLIAYLKGLKFGADNSENDSNAHKKHGHSSERPQITDSTFIVRHRFLHELLPAYRASKDDDEKNKTDRQIALPARLLSYGAEGETRTPMKEPSLDPEPSVSTNSTTSARRNF